jgi:serine/threonine protein phosphatase 1
MADLQVIEADSFVQDILAVVVGHTPLRQPAVLGNVYHIDIGGWLPDGRGHFTLLNLATLQSIPPMPAELDWEGDGEEVSHG